VDPVSRREFWNILTELHLQGTTILVSTPYMDEADRCSRVGLMYAGKLVECDTPLAIRNRLEGEVIQVQAGDWQAVLETVAGLEGIREAQTYGESVNLLVDNGKKRLREVERALKKSGIQYRSIRIAPARMEEAFNSLIRKMESA
jgi:ABC-2 type transport system ATP-binding protein